MGERVVNLTRSDDHPKTVCTLQHFQNPLCNTRPIFVLFSLIPILQYRTAPRKRALMAVFCAVGLFTVSAALGWRYMTLPYRSVQIHFLFRPPLSAPWSPPAVTNMQWRSQGGWKGWNFIPLFGPRGPFSFKTIKHCNISMSTLVKKSSREFWGFTPGLQEPILGLSDPSQA